MILEFQIRLIDGFSLYNGRVEIFHEGRWGTVCDDFWNAADASVVCTSLGFDARSEALGSAYFGPGSGVIHLDNTQCRGDEPSLDKCIHNGWGYHNCGHEEDASVICNPDTEGIY